MTDFETPFAAKTRPFAADVSDATKTLETAIEDALDVSDAEILYAELDGVRYVVAPIGVEE